MPNSIKSHLIPGNGCAHYSANHWLLGSIVIGCILVLQLHPTSEWGSIDGQLLLPWKPLDAASGLDLGSVAATFALTSNSSSQSIIVAAMDATTVSKSIYTRKRNCSRPLSLENR